ncbi:glycoside hydrolase/deacetylase [Gigaspora margarita]|uniref:chitin deacetylase n=1 Tax=Gigaspora margarita TaxID=4874 RepID=A0A8H4B3W5_GIGMA|nr:glycoside hydrolase/deacetylase [Gigaspora margarita]
MNFISDIKFLFKFLSIYLLIQLSTGAMLPGNWPTLDEPPPILAEYTKLVDLSKVANAAIRTISDVNIGKCPNPDEYCHWGCTQCVRNQTDIITCPNVGDWGITLDDGPSPQTTAILDFLEAQNIKVTFFVVGSRVVEYPEILQRAYKLGHQIGVHTWSHPSLTTQTNEQVISELQWTAEVIKAAIGVVPSYMRPPYGDFDDRIRGICEQLGYKIVTWDSDTNDWRSNTDKTFKLSWIEGNFTEWVKQPGKPGHISLEHDLYKGAAAQVPSVINIVTKAGYKVKPVGTCLGNDNFYQSNATTPVPPNSTASTTSLLAYTNTPTSSTPASSTTPNTPKNPTPSSHSKSTSFAIKSNNFDNFLWSIIIGAILFTPTFL